MKKVFSIFAACVLVLFTGLSFVGCKKQNEAGVIRINEVTHSVFYAPLYVAINLGFMEDEGVKIELTNGGGSDVSMAALLSGSADIALMGPETVVYVEANGSNNHPIVFGQLTKKDGCFLISKQQYTDFDYKRDMANKTAIIGRDGGMPAMTFEWICNSVGLINGTNITLDTATAFNMMVPVFENTSAEFCTMFEPTASEFVEANKGYYVDSVGEHSGEIPYTCFMAYPDFISKNTELISGFLRAIKRAYNYIVSSSSMDVAKALAPSFDTTKLESLAKAVEKYIEIDVWSSSPAMSKDSFNRLLTVLKNSKKLASDKNVEFSKIVNNSYANQI